jgi:hypothetical protein
MLVGVRFASEFNMRIIGGIVGDGDGQRWRSSALKVP